MLKKYNKILGFDCETTGLNFYTDKIIEFGATFGDEEYNELLQWDDIKELEPIIIELTKITMDEINLNGKPSKEVIDKIKYFFENADLLVAYNLPFDLSMVENGIRYYYPDFSLNDLKADYLDILAITRDWKKFDKRKGETHRLDSACNYWAVELSGAHRAINDVNGMMLLLEAMEKDGINIDLYINRVGYYEQYGISPHLSIPNKIKLYSQGFKAERYIVNASELE